MVENPGSVEALHVEVAGKLLFRKDLLPVVSNIPSERRLGRKEGPCGLWICGSMTI